MTEPLVFSHFEPRLNESFHVDGGVTLQLVECNRLKPVEGQPREPFSLLFRGPHNAFLQQRIYALQNEHLGNLEIFLVPVAREANGFMYEAVFN